MWLLWFITIRCFECCGLQFTLGPTYNQKENYILSLKFLMYDRVLTIGRWKALQL